MAVFGDFLAAESHPSGASPVGALVSTIEMVEGRSIIIGHKKAAAAIRCGGK